LADAAGNTRVLNAADLRARGFPARITVAEEATNSATAEAHNEATIFVGLKSRDDVATSFDVRVERYHNGVLVSASQATCVGAQATEPEKSRKVSVPMDATLDGASAGVFSIRILARIGTNPDGTNCSGRSRAAGLRLYFGTADWPSSVTVGPSQDRLMTLFLHSRQGSDVLTPDSPTASSVAVRESGDLESEGGNPWREVGVWRTQ
jgi:hypothetical protein